MTIDTSVSTLPFVGPIYQKNLANLGISTIGSLLYHLPSRYVDLSKMTLIEDLVEGELQVIKAVVESVKKVRLKGGRVMITVMVNDGTDQLQLTWFNQPFIEKALIQGQEYRFAGEAEYKFGKFQMSNPTHELASKPMVHTGRIVPIYPLTAGISSKWLRARIAPLLPRLESLVPEFLPASTVERNHLSDLWQALLQLHAPESFEHVQRARQRLGFDELLLLQLAALERKSALSRGPEAESLSLSAERRNLFEQSLPFTLTQAQRQVIDEILHDISRSTPMNRLIEGDVGSGKTVVAALAALAAIESGLQVAIMAPTSVLAQQHFGTFQSLFALRDTTGLRPISISLRTSKSKSDPADITIGTHALIADGVTFEKLGLVIIDEQHRFGVEQRAQLMGKAQSGVHLLSMTATPIPRTLALTAYGDLDLSIIDELPANRLKVKTHIVPKAKRSDMEQYLEQAFNRGEQAFIVCPLIEESDSLTEVRAATAEFERLQKVFPYRSLALLHGRMKSADKDTVLGDFKDHIYDALVTTSVVEVGIDVPNATMLIIEGAERFGLAQLHQLRGRVGRGDKQSYCFLLSDASDSRDIHRLAYMEQESSGIRLAELDLATRGPGEVYGHRQSGIPELKAASFTDVELVQTTRQEAAVLLEDGLEHYPLLQTELQRSQKLIELN